MAEREHVVIRTVAPPRDSVLAHLFAEADLVDAFAVTLPKTTTRDIVVLARSVLGDPAPWFRMLLGIRDAVMVRFGVKTSRALRAEADRGGAESIDFFRVRSRSDREVVVGEDDRHLDFRASILLRGRPDGDADEVVATTVVHCRNRIGRAYLLTISPVHRSVVRSNLRRAAEKGWSAR